MILAHPIHQVGCQTTLPAEPFSGDHHVRDPTCAATSKKFCTDVHATSVRYF
jgi:hypothetical protein